MNILKQGTGAVLLAVVVVFSVYASDSAKEQRWANQIVEFLIDGEPRWLEAGEQKFLGIYTPARGPYTKGAVILLHGGGAHPDWPQVIQPLRTQLPDTGWATLALQMPVLHSGASNAAYVPLFKEVPARIEAGLTFLSQQGVSNVILLGHSLGSNMASDYLARNRDPRVKGFVGIGMVGNPQPDEHQVLDNVAALLRMKVPVLDVYGSQTVPEILQSVDRRAFAVYQTGNDHSRQIEISGANHFFQGYEAELLQSVASWITMLVNPQQASKFERTDNVSQLK
ncbi:MAG: alpha/beta fold hydrolase [Gammaproteobacteria bacterium]